MAQISPTTGRCNTCGKIYPIEHFKLKRKKSQKAPWREWKCRECKREYDTKQKRKKRQGDGHEHYNDYMRDYMRGYKKEKP